jgi:hypothetical protein
MDASSAKTLPLPEGKYKMRKSLRNLAAVAAVAALLVAGESET